MFLIYLCHLIYKAMYQTLTFYHSIVRWFVLLSLLCCIIRAFRGYTGISPVFSKTDNSVRHWTATIAHIQLVIGIILYTQSPMIKYFWKNFTEARGNRENFFFALIHIVLMLSAIVFITIGSAAAKRKTVDREKFRTMLIWFSLALIIVLVAIPWPFSPLAQRPFLR